MNWFSKKEVVKILDKVPEIKPHELWLEAEMKKPYYVIEVDTGLDVIVSNPFHPYANDHYRRTSRELAINRTTNDKTFLEIEVGETHYTIPVSNIITMKVRPEFEDE